MTLLQAMKNTASLTILHLSDPQFGHNHGFGNMPSPTDPKVSFDTLLQRLTDDLDSLKREKGIKPQVVVVSGDLAEQGTKPEFEDALKFLDGLSAHLKLSHGRVVIVPGNHDVSWDLCKEYFKQCQGNNEEPAEPYAPKWANYLWLFQRFYKNELELVLAPPCGAWTFWEFRDLKLVVAGLNSTMKESHEEHYGWVGEGQLRWFAEKLAFYKDQGWFRLGVVHHNVLRGASDDDENLKDADDLERLLGPSLNLLIHGHTHDSKMQWLGRYLQVLSTGSAALNKKARPEAVPNQYQAICIWPDRVERWTRSYDPRRKRWMGDTSCSVDGSDWHSANKVTFERVHGIFPSRLKRFVKPAFLGVGLALVLAIFLRAIPARQYRPPGPDAMQSTETQKELQFSPGTGSIVVVVSSFDEVNKSKQKGGETVSSHYPAFTDYLRNTNLAMKVVEVISPGGDQLNLGESNVVILGGPRRNSSFEHIRDTLLPFVPQVPSGKHLPFDFSQHVYDSKPPYTWDAQNGIVVGYDDSGLPITQADSMRRYCQREGEPWYFRSEMARPPRFAFQRQQLCSDAGEWLSNTDSTGWPPAQGGTPDYKVDYGFFLIGPNPLDPKNQRQIVMISGTHMPGTSNAIEYIEGKTKGDVNRLKQAADHIQGSNHGYWSGVLRVTPDGKANLVRSVVF